MAINSLRPRNDAVYRVVLEQRLAKLARRKSKFIDDPLYHQDDAGVAIDAIVAQEDLMSDARDRKTAAYPGIFRRSWRTCIERRFSRRQKNGRCS